MEQYPPHLEKLIGELSRLPTIGRKSAQRLAFFILEAEPDFARSLGHAILELKSRIRLCSKCFHITEHDPCEICSDPGRDKGLLCVIEDPGDIFRFEKSGFRGTYHVLHGCIKPLKGITPEHLKIRELLQRVERERFREIIIGTNPSMEGEATALYLVDVLKRYPVKLSRIGMGVPLGGSLEYVDEVTLKRSLENRSEYPK